METVRGLVADWIGSHRVEGRYGQATDKQRTESFSLSLEALRFFSKSPKCWRHIHIHIHIKQRPKGQHAADQRLGPRPQTPSQKCDALGTI